MRTASAPIIPAVDWQLVTLQRAAAWLGGLAFLVAAGATVINISPIVIHDEDPDDPTAEPSHITASDDFMAAAWIVTGILVAASLVLWLIVRWGERE